jgi:hypothetical protein
VDDPTSVSMRVLENDEVAADTDDASPLSDANRQRRAIGCG